MELSGNSLNDIWKNKDDFWKNNRDNEAVKRYNWLEKKFEILMGTDIEIIDDSSLKINGHTRRLNTTVFGPAEDGLPANSTPGCLKEIEQKIVESLGSDTNREKTEDELKNLALSVWQILTGSYEDYRRNPLFRIFSSTTTGLYETRNVEIPRGKKQNPDAHFASNNYFFHIINFLKKVRDNETDIKFNEIIGDDRDKVPLILRWHDVKDSQTIEHHRNALKHRFPLKFLWMWANRKSVISLISLKAFQVFCRSELFSELVKELKLSDDLKSDPLQSLLINREYDKFTVQWREISKAVLTKLSTDAQQIKDLSRVLSILLLGEIDTRNILELVSTGNKAVILYGPPGTGKTYEAWRVAAKLVGCEDVEELKDEKGLKVGESGKIKFIQFHPSYSYEDFIGGIKPKVHDDGKTMIYKVEDGSFKAFCDEARNDQNHNYVFIIDEINRAHLSSVLGEVLYCLEYRNSRIKIPHFDEPFFIPDNVYIIGTMNNVDKSLVTFDLALRRRFSFYLHKPNIDLLEEMKGFDNFDPTSLKNYIDRCKALNNAIKKELRLYDEYQIGHAYFMKIKDFFPIKKENNKKSDDNELNKPPMLFKITSLELEKLWDYYLRPLLEEYLGNSVKNLEKELQKLKESFCKADV